MLQLSAIKTVILRNYFTKTPGTNFRNVTCSSLLCVVSFSIGDNSRLTVEKPVALDERNDAKTAMQ